LATDGDTPLKHGLREHKKHLLRQQPSDTATELFVERGFDNVRVAEIAEAWRRRAAPPAGST